MWLARCQSCPDLGRPGHSGCPEDHSEPGPGGQNPGVGRLERLLATAGTVANIWPSARVPAQGHRPTGTLPQESPRTGGLLGANPGK